MKRLAIGVVLLVISVSLVGPIFGQGGAEELPLADQKAFKAKEAAPQGEQKQVDQKAPQVDVDVPEGKALVYIYRAADPLGSKYDPLVLSKEGPIGVLPSGGCISYVADPGRVPLWIVSAMTRELTIEAVTGQKYYAKGGFKIPWSPPPDVFLELVTREEGEAEMAGCEPVPQ